MPPIGDEVLSNFRQQVDEERAYAAKSFGSASLAPAGSPIPTSKAISDGRTSGSSRWPA